MSRATKDSRLKRAGVSGYNKPKRTPNHPKKSHIVVAKEGSKIKTIRFGEKGAKTAGKPKKGESRKMKMKRKSFKARHAKNIKKGKMYTKPTMRKRIFNRIKAGGKGGKPGQWSARKAQMLAKAYKKAGGGYK
jgi:hypothetical protein